MRSSLLHLLLLFGLSQAASAQIGGNNVYSFLNLPSSSRISGLGGRLISATDGDIALAYENPALSQAKMDNQLSFQHQFLLAGIQTGYASFGKWFESTKLMTHAGIKYVLFGEFDQSDVMGNIVGSFKGNEIVMHVGASYQLYEKLRIGANLNFINSTLEVYRSSAVAVDVGALYVDTSGLFSAGFSLKNAGTQLSPFNDQRESLPLNISVGISKRLKHLPFRFSLVYDQLQSWNLMYDDPSSQETGFFGTLQPAESQPSQIDNFFRHLIFGGEFILGKKDLFRIRLGYNHQRKQELSIANFRTITGFSMGFGIRIKKLQFDYALSKIHFGGSTHHLGISTNIKHFIGTQILD